MSEIDDLREEVAFWRREMAATLWFACADFETARGLNAIDSEIVKANVALRVRPIIAAFASADAKDWHSDKCESCGAAIKPGEPYLCDGDGIVHCKDHLYGEPSCLMDGTPEDVAADVEKAKTLLASYQ